MIQKNWAWMFFCWEHSYYFPALAVANHVTDLGKQPIKFKTDVAMMGKLGFDIRVNEMEKMICCFARMQ